MQLLTLFRAIQFILPNNCYIQVIYPIKYIFPTGSFFDAMPFFAHTADTSDQCHWVIEQHSKKGPVRSKTFHDQIRFSTAIIHILNLMTQVYEGSLFYKNMHFSSQNSHYVLLFHDGDPYHTETNPLICIARDHDHEKEYIGTTIMKELSPFKKIFKAKIYVKIIWMCMRCSTSSEWPVYIQFMSCVQAVLLN